MPCKNRPLWCWGAATAAARTLFSHPQDRGPDPLLHIWITCIHFSCLLLASPLADRLTIPLCSCVHFHPAPCSCHPSNPSQNMSPPSTFLGHLSPSSSHPSHGLPELAVCPLIIWDLRGLMFMWILLAHLFLSSLREGSFP